MTNTFIQGTLEFQPVSIKLDGVPVFNNVQFSVVLIDDTVETEAGTFSAATSLDGKIGVMLTPDMVIGYYKIYAQITDTPEIPIKDCGTVRIVP